MTNKNSKNKYPPKDRDFLTPSASGLVSESETGSSTPLPSNVEDDIVANNIANAEFNYTENLFGDDQL